MSKQELTSLLQRYFSKEITPVEKQALATLIAQSADEELIKESVEDIWNQYQPQEQLPASTSGEYYDRILQQIRPSQSAGGQETKAVPPVHRIHFLRSTWARLAAAAIVIAIAGSIVYLLLPSGGGHSQPSPTSTLADSRPLIRNITLPDGSKVVLQANSQLDYPASFDGKTREVTLTGEAFFDVAHNAARPFIIHSGKIKTTVLGTAFNIKAWPSDKEVIVTVTRGKVKVEDDSRVLGIITPDQQISFNTQSEETKQSAVNATQETSWKEEAYTMNDMTLEEALTEIQVRYGTIIELASGENAGNCRFTTSFKQDESLDYVLNVICKIYRASWNRKENRIIISNVNCQ